MAEWRKVELVRIGISFFRLKDLHASLSMVGDLGAYAGLGLDGGARWG